MAVSMTKNVVLPLKGKDPACILDSSITTGGLHLQGLLLSA